MGISEFDVCTFGVVRNIFRDFFRFFTAPEQCAAEIDVLAVALVLQCDHFAAGMGQLPGDCCIQPAFV